MAKQKKNQFNLEITRQLKHLDADYQQVFMKAVYLITSDERKSRIDQDAAIHLILQECQNGMKQKKKAMQVFGNHVDDYIVKISRGPRFKQMRKQLRNQDYEKFIISSIWILFSLSIILFFFKNLLMNQFLIHYIVDVAIACIAGGLAIGNVSVKYRVLKKYGFERFVMKVDVVALISCIFIKVISPSNFDVTYLLLVIAFFITKRKVKPQFEKVLED